MNAIDTLHSDHQKFLKLFSEIESTPKTMPDERHELYLRFELILTLHMLSEERVFYKALLELPEISDVIKKSYESHHLINVATHELKLTPYSSDKWLPKFQAIRDNILAHMAEEENYLFPKVRELLPELKLLEIAEKMAKFREDVIY